MCPWYWAEQCKYLSLQNFLSSKMSYIVFRHMFWVNNIIRSLLTRNDQWIGLELKQDILVVRIVLIFLLTGSFEDAAKNFEMFYSLAKEKPDWTTPEGTNMYSQSCNHLTRIYTVLSDQYLAKNDNETCLSYLTQAYRMAQDGKWFQPICKFCIYHDYHYYLFYFSIFLIWIRVHL